MLHHRLFLAILAGSAVATLALPANADPVLVVTAEVVTPTGDVMGGLVVPHGSPPGSTAGAGANINFKSKHSASITGGTANSTYIVDALFSFKLAEGAVPPPHDPASVSTWQELGHKSAHTESAKIGVNGEWKNDAKFTNVTIEKTKFMDSIPSAPPQFAVRYIAQAQTIVTASPGIAPKSDDDNRNFSVSQP